MKLITQARAEQKSPLARGFLLSPPTISARFPAPIAILPQNPYPNFVFFRPSDTTRRNNASFSRAGAFSVHFKASGNTTPKALAMLLVYGFLEPFKRISASDTFSAPNSAINHSAARLSRSFSIIICQTPNPGCFHAAAAPAPVRLLYSACASVSPCNIFACALPRSLPSR